MMNKEAIQQAAEDRYPNSKDPHLGPIAREGLNWEQERLRKAFIAGAEWMQAQGCAHDYRKVLSEINHVCGTVNYSSHNQMKEAIVAAVELSDEALSESSRAPVGEAPQKMGIGKLRALLHAFDSEQISMSKFLEEINIHFLGGGKYVPEASNTDSAPVVTPHSSSGNSADQEGEKGGWIAVSDSLPEIGQHVLLYTEYLSSGKEAHDMFVGYRDEYGECFQADDDSYGWQFDDCVTHWMKLPEPPKSK